MPVSNRSESVSSSTTRIVPGLFIPLTRLRCSQRFPTHPVRLALPWTNGVDVQEKRPPRQCDSGELHEIAEQPSTADQLGVWQDPRWVVPNGPCEHATPPRGGCLLGLVP